MSSVLKKADKLNLSLSLSMTGGCPEGFVFLEPDVWYKGHVCCGQ